MPFFYLQVFLEYHGLPENVAFYSLSILNAASIFGRTIPNAFADRVGPMNIFLPMAGVTSVLIFAM